MIYKKGKPTHEVNYKIDPMIRSAFSIIKDKSLINRLNKIDDLLAAHQQLINSFYSFNTLFIV